MAEPSATDKKVAKYFNSPESELYDKSRVLYGIDLAKGAIVKNDECYLVEGYTDVISLHQNEVENVVASAGTSLTENQIRLIRRYTQNVCLLFDGDAAGIRASFRGIDMLLKQGLNVRVVTFPEGEDPDSFARKTPSGEFIDYLVFRFNEAIVTLRVHETDRSKPFACDAKLFGWIVFRRLGLVFSHGVGSKRDQWKFVSFPKVSGNHQRDR